LEPKTLHPESLRVISARRKIQAAKHLLGAWREGTWRDVAGWLGDEHKAGACCRLVGDVDTFRPSVALIALIEATALPGAPPRARKRYHRPCMDDDTYAAWLRFKEQQDEQPHD
jgi:hypothetical protein